MNMSRKLFLVLALASPTLLALNPNLAHGKEEFFITIDKPITGIESEKATAITALSSILGTNEGDVSSRLKFYYKELQNGKKISANKNTINYAVLLKTLIPSICSDQESENIKNLIIKSSEDKINGDFVKNDINKIASSEAITVEDSILAIISLSQIACESIVKKQKNSDITKQGSDDPEKIDYLNGGVVTNDSDFNEAMLKQFGITKSDFLAKKKHDIDEINSKGFIEVDNDEIVNLDQDYQKNKSEFKTLADVASKITFTPSLVIEKSNYTNLGAVPAGTVGDSGFSTISQLYETPMGKVRITEDDIIASNSIISVEPEFLNEKIGGNKASLIVTKAKEKDLYKTEIFWVDDALKKSYTVEINKNLNDPSVKQEKEELLKTLNKLN